MYMSHITMSVYYYYNSYDPKPAVAPDPPNVRRRRRKKMEDKGSSHSSLLLCDFETWCPCQVQSRVPKTDCETIERFRCNPFGPARCHFTSGAKHVHSLWEFHWKHVQPQWILADSFCGWVPWPHPRTFSKIISLYFIVKSQKLNLCSQTGRKMAREEASRGMHRNLSNATPWRLLVRFYHGWKMHVESTSCNKKELRAAWSEHIEHTSFCHEWLNFTLMSATLLAVTLMKVQVKHSVLVMSDVQTLHFCLRLCPTDIIFTLLVCKGFTNTFWNVWE